MNTPHIHVHSLNVTIPSLEREWERFKLACQPADMAPGVSEDFLKSLFLAGAGAALSQCKEVTAKTWSLALDTCLKQVASETEKLAAANLNQLTPPPNAGN